MKMFHARVRRLQVNDLCIFAEDQAAADRILADLPSAQVDDLAAWAKRTGSAIVEGSLTEKRYIREGAYGPYQQAPVAGTAGDEA